MNPLKFILVCLAGWIQREQQAVIEYLQEEIRVLKDIHGRRLRFDDAQRRRLAAKAKKIRFGRLKEIAGVATPHTLRAWFRKLIADKYDSGSKRAMGRPRTKDQIVNLVVQFASENETWGYTKIRDALSEYVAHYHEERNHQGLESRIIRPEFQCAGEGEIRRKQRLGGMLNFYCREAA